MRVVSLVPSVTETLLSWGVTPVAVTRFCEQPGLPAVGGTKDPDIAGVVASRPDLVVMNDEENRIEDAEALVASGLDVHVVRIRALEDVGSELALLRRRLALPEAGAPAPLRPPPPGMTVRAFVPIWRRPWMTLNGDTYGSSLLAAVGAVNVFASAAERYPTITLDAAARLSPDVVLAPSEPYPFRDRHVPELEQVAPVELVDGRDLFWWGSRTPAALSRLRRIAGARAGRPES
jgi:ABC-type Fe3+-hydroxamate transport system substrate-binding protein